MRAYLYSESDDCDMTDFVLDHLRVLMLARLPLNRGAPQSGAPLGFTRAYARRSLK